MMAEPRIVVVGCGAIGGTILANLARAGRDVTGIDFWPDHIYAVQAGGLQVQAVEESFVVHPRIDFSDSLARGEKFDIVVLSVKGYDNRWAALLAQDLLAEDGILLSAQNGMHEDDLASVVGSERVVGCVVAMAAEAMVAGSVRCPSGSEWVSLIFGELDGSESSRVRELGEIFAPVGRIELSTAIRGKLWAKMMMNVMSNAVGGIGDLTTRYLWTDRDAADIIVALGHEATQIAVATGEKPADVLGAISPASLLGATSLSSPEWKEVVDKLYVLGQGRSGARENLPSLLQDLRKGRRSEIDYLNGVICTLGVEYGVATPVNDMVVDVMHRLERGEIQRGAELLADTSTRVRSMVPA
jgi:2-dehydropantoate 2-reductase